MSLILKSIKEEATDCRAAGKGFKAGTFALHCHHKILAEPLTEDAENRIAYIISSKPKHEQALRLRLFRPVPEKKLAKRQKADAERQKAYAEWQKADAERQKAYAEWEKAYAEREKADAELAVLIHAKVCKDCPWDGKTIFSKERP
jgi:hypothetical protein